MKDLIPWGRSRALARGGESTAFPFLSLHRDMNRLFDDAFRTFGFNGGWPSVEVSDHGKELHVTAELPGLEEKDVNVEIDEGVLTISGEKRTEVEDEKRRYSERSYGRFERRLALPDDVDEDNVKAAFKNGVLTLTLPKSDRARQNVKRIPVNGG
jgi:HSP20 family protein